MASLERDLREAEKTLKLSGERHAEMERAIAEANAVIERARKVIKEIASSNEVLEKMLKEVSP